MCEGDPDNPAFDDAFYKVAAFRETFAYPLYIVTKILRKRALSTDLGAVVSSRSKRITSIVTKLSRQPAMKLTTMQDLGGCRAILSSIGQVNRLVKDFRVNIAPRLNEPVEIFDYISRPKADGYRGVHYVVRYHPKRRKLNGFPSRRIEIQLRSKLQHEWAMAVETVDLFTSQTLKLGGGNPKWQRFFLLASKLFGVKEGFYSIEDDSEWMKELRNLWYGLGVPSLIMQWFQAMDSSIPDPPSEDAMYLIRVDVENMTTMVKTIFF